MSETLERIIERNREEAGYMLGSATQVMLAGKHCFVTL
jgi:hypothetical protein